MFEQGTKPEWYAKGLLLNIDSRILQSQGAMVAPFNIKLPQGEDNVFIRGNRIDTSYSFGAYHYYSEIIKYLPSTVQVQLKVGPVSSSHNFMGRTYKDPPNAYCELIVTPSQIYVNERYQYYYLPYFEDKLLATRQEELRKIVGFLIENARSYPEMVVFESCIRPPLEYEENGGKPGFSYSKLGLKPLTIPQQFTLSKVLTNFANQNYKNYSFINFTRITHELEFHINTKGGTVARNDLKSLNEW